MKDFGTSIKQEKNNNLLFYSFEYSEIDENIETKSPTQEQSADSNKCQNNRFDKSLSSEKEYASILKLNEVSAQRTNLNQSDLVDPINPSVLQGISKNIYIF